MLPKHIKEKLDAALESLREFEEKTGIDSTQITEAVSAWAINLGNAVMFDSPESREKQKEIFQRLHATGDINAALDEANALGQAELKKRKAVFRSLWKNLSPLLVDVILKVFLQENKNGG